MMVKRWMITIVLYLVVMSGTHIIEMVPFVREFMVNANMTFDALHIVNVNVLLTTHIYSYLLKSFQPHKSRDICRILTLHPTNIFPAADSTFQQQE